VATVPKSPGPINTLLPLASENTKPVYLLYMEHKKIELIHKQTKIPRYSIRKTIREMKSWIIKKWNDKLEE
jgi:hypothetical protein